MERIISMSSIQPNEIFLKDYQPPEFEISKTKLTFHLGEDATKVDSELTLRRLTAGADLKLDGQEMELLSLLVDGAEVSAENYALTEDFLTVRNLPDNCVLSVSTKIEPQNNTSLEGLYKSGKMFCTQCEAEGFRKITYYLDRPDVLSEFTTTVVGDPGKYPVLLSNGNKIDEGTTSEGLCWATWHDPFPKPCYLFALVAGSLVNIDGHFTTASGRDVLLRIFVEEKDVDKCDHAMTSLINAMKWDEEVYGREYDLDIFMIVAVDDFNMGAMENKGLNIFNTSCVLANPQTTTDAGFQRVEGVVAHEYFHNWSGNRVTCRDWFQLSLKEGFTVFRDSEFSADMGSRTVKRVEDVSLLRSMQYAEDAGPMAHPVRPASFIEISNFYTLTVYEKGAEVVRMVHTLLGEELFRKGSDLYFERHDGQAVTVEDFVAAMSDVSGRDFSQFMNWYHQAGTPELKVTSDYDVEAKTFTLTFTQRCRPTSECENKKPYHIPIAMGLIGDAGALPLNVSGYDNHDTSDNTNIILEITEKTQTFTFEHVEEEPVPSLLRGLSAPVNLKYNYSRDSLLKIMSQDEDGFSRWNASQQLAVQVIGEVMSALTTEPAPKVDEKLVLGLKSLLGNDTLDPAMVALMLDLPTESYLAEQQTVADIDLIHHARNRVQRKLAVALFSDFKHAYNSLNTGEEFSVSAEAVARRSLKNVALHYLVLQGADESLKTCLDQFNSATNMTDEFSALTAMVCSPKPSALTYKKDMLARFLEKWKHEPLVVNQWFSVQACNPLPGTIGVVRELLVHPMFDIKNPNKLRALIGGFAMRNPVNFHDKSGSGYQFLGEQIQLLNSQNPQIASRLLTPLTKWRKYDENRRALMLAELKKISELPSLSKDVYEVVTKSMNG